MPVVRDTLNRLKLLRDAQKSARPDISAGEAFRQADAQLDQLLN
jgi:hypothetical protein